MLRDVKIALTDLSFGVYTNDDYPVRVQGTAHYITANGTVNFDRSYKIFECWTVSHAARVFRDLQDALPSTCELNWDY